MSGSKEAQMSSLFCRRDLGCLIQIALTLAFLIFFGPLHAQSQNGNLVTNGRKFEVASVRMVPESSSGFTSISPWGEPSFRATNATLDVLIQLAFGVLENQVTHAPTWLESQEYDIKARPENNQILTYDEAKPLLQELLKDRFHLAVHSELKEIHGYALVVSKNGPKLETSKGISGPRYFSKKHLRSPDSSMSTLAGLLTSLTGVPVSDETGITGNFDIELDYASEDDLDSSLPTLLIALQEQLGLKVISRKISEKILVIDHVDRVPTEN